jgi:DNA-binding response OmpR family regulator
MPTKSILIVEDDVAIRETLELVLKEETTYQALLAQDAETALTLLQTATPGLFLLDYRLPGMNGVQLIDHIREIKAFEQTPIILMSAGRFWTRNPRDVRYLSKPFDLDEFLQVINECLSMPRTTLRFP